MCKSWCELILAVIIIVFAFWQTAVSMWIIVIAGIVLLIHSFTCKTCFAKHNTTGRKR
ncbi:MAG: hypothetical protein AABW75_01780 [Nanoarchaeota archaeon]